MTDKSKILICVPTYESVCPETFKSIYDLEVPKSAERPDFEFVKGYGCALARNKSASMAVNQGYDYLMFVDSDIQLPVKSLTYMLEYDCDVCMGIYPRRNNSSGKTEVFLETAYNFYDENNLNAKNIPENIARVNIKGGGMGCALIKTSVFKHMNYPYFEYVQYDDGTTLSEDNYFCWQAKTKAGALIQLDTRVKCKHKSAVWQSI